ncbi:MAG: hypothetical protein ABI594_21620 [Ginsengibacter sp.]
MENVSTDFLESTADFTTLETQQIPSNLQAANSPEGDDEDEEDDNNEKEDGDQGGDKTTGSDDDNPPLDKDVVHSPLTTQPGGKPK